jgi:hypothetical protein
MDKEDLMWPFARQDVFSAATGFDGSQRPRASQIELLPHRAQ